MTPFDQHWQQTAAQARQAPQDAAAELPFGFSTRVLARFQETPAEAWEDVFSAIGLRALLATTGLLLISAGYALTEWYDFRLEPPSLEEAVTSELSWP